MLDLKVYHPGMQHDIKDFFGKCFSDLGWAYEPHDRHSDTVNIQQEYMQSGCFWCLYDGGRLIGTVAIRTIDFLNKTAELKRLYVIEEEQGNGSGGLLFNTAVEYAKDNGFCKICADTQNDRNASQHLMRKSGFKETQKYNDNQFTDLFFELFL
jgi:Sortase and related acyltransferases